MKLLPFHPLPSPLLLLDKELYDPLFAHSYQLVKKMDSNISKVCASMADLLMSLDLAFDLENLKLLP